MARVLGRNTTSYIGTDKIMALDGRQQPFLKQTKDKENICLPCQVSTRNCSGKQQQQQQQQQQSGSWNFVDTMHKYVYVFSIICKIKLILYIFVRVCARAQAKEDRAMMFMEEKK